jgi:uncharacterized DUF497 family protein
MVVSLVVCVGSLTASVRAAGDSETEERWLTLGGNDALLVVTHTFEELSDEESLVRVISAREAVAHERAQYESG